MIHKKIIVYLFGIFLSPVCALAASAEQWDYGGREGPEHWAELNGHNLPCSTGSQQSPVNIAQTIEADLPSLQIRWKSGGGTMVNNGHTIQVDLAGGGMLIRGDERFRLKQFHFHAPSEHRVEGKAFPMEAHFVHEDEETGILGVLSVFIVPGEANGAFADLASAFPAHEGEQVSLHKVELTDLLPDSLDYWLYEGSLTTPPCSEDVEWMIAVEPIEVDAADIARFTALYSRNARPIRAPNRRFILRGD